MKDTHIDYFPIKRALLLKGKREEEDMKLDEVRSLVQTINDRLTPLEELVRNHTPTGAPNS